MKEPGLELWKMESNIAITRTVYLHTGGEATITNCPKPHVTHKEFCNFTSCSQVQWPKHCGESGRKESETVVGSSQPKGRHCLLKYNVISMHVMRGLG